MVSKKSLLAAVAACLIVVASIAGYSFVQDNFIILSIEQAQQLTVDIQNFAAQAYMAGAASCGKTL